MRLHVAERPARRHHRRAGDRGEVLERAPRIAGVEDEDVGRSRARSRRSAAGPCRAPAAGCARSAARSRSAVGRHGSSTPRLPSRISTWTHGAATNRPQPRVPSIIATGLRDPYMSLCQRGSIVSRLPRRSNWTGSSRQLRPFCGRGPPSPMPEHRLLVERERHVAVVGEADLLHQRAVGIADRDGQRLRRHRHLERSDLAPHRLRQRTYGDPRRRITAIDERRVGRQRLLHVERLERDAKAVIAGDPDVELRRLAGGHDRLRVQRGGKAGGEERSEGQVSEVVHRWRNLARITNGADADRTESNG